MTAADIDEVVRLQVEALSDSLVTRLGTRFLLRFYQTALGDPATIGLVAASAGRLAGFALGTTDGTRFRSRVRSHTLLPLLRALASHPGLVPRFLRSVLQQEPSSPIDAELLFLAVSTDFRRQQVATALLRALEDHFRSADLPGYRVAVRSWLKPAIEFYRSQGFELDAEATVLGAPMSYFRRRLSGPS